MDPVRKRPLFVGVIGWVYIAAGATGIVYHLPELGAQHPFRYDAVVVELVRLLAIVAGASLLRGHNWARWVALGWMAYHVILSAFHTKLELAMHGLLLAVLAFSLLGRRATAYFGEARASG